MRRPSCEGMLRSEAFSVEPDPPPPTHTPSPQGWDGSTWPVLEGTTATIEGYLSAVQACSLLMTLPKQLSLLSFLAQY